MTIAEVTALGAQIGPLFSGVGILFTAGAAWTTYYFYYRKTTDSNWLDTFRKLYEEFWRSDEMAKMRKYIASEEEYAKMESILLKRMTQINNNLNSEENDMLELVDRFCSLMIRILSFGEASPKSRRNSLYDPLFYYWIRAIKNRDALMHYIEIYWQPLHRRLGFWK